MHSGCAGLHCIGILALSRRLAYPACCRVLQGDGFITNKQAVQQWGISTPSDMFTTPLTDWVGPLVRLEHGKAQVRTSQAQLDTQMAVIDADGIGHDFTPLSSRRLFCLLVPVEGACWEKAGPCMELVHCSNGALGGGATGPANTHDVTTDVHNVTAFTASINSCCRVLLCQCPRFVLAPHIYPTSITGAVDEIAAAIETITYRWDQSWGWKMQGTDTTYQVRSVIVCCAFFYECVTWPLLNMQALNAVG